MHNDKHEHVVDADADNSSGDSIVGLVGVVVGDKGSNCCRAMAQMMAVARW